jgi:hypothetical protein
LLGGGNISRVNSSDVQGQYLSSGSFTVFLAVLPFSHIRVRCLQREQTLRRLRDQQHGRIRLRQSSTATATTGRPPWGHAHSKQ